MTAPSAVKKQAMASASEAKKPVTLPERMVLAAFGGMGAATFCHPIDTIRINMQIRQYAGGIDAVLNASTPGMPAGSGSGRGGGVEDGTIAVVDGTMHLFPTELLGCSEREDGQKSSTKFLRQCKKYAPENK